MAAKICCIDVTKKANVELCKETIYEAGYRIGNIPKYEWVDKPEFADGVLIICAEKELPNQKWKAKQKADYSQCVVEFTTENNILNVKKNRSFKVMTSILNSVSKMGLKDNGEAHIKAANSKSVESPEKEDKEMETMNKENRKNRFEELYNKLQEQKLQRELMEKFCKEMANINKNNECPCSTASEEPYDEPMMNVGGRGEQNAEAKPYPPLSFLHFPFSWK